MTFVDALADAPVAQTARIVKKFKEWTDPASELPDDAVDRDQLLTNVTPCWLTNMGGLLADLLRRPLHVAAASSELRHPNQSRHVP